MDLSRCQRWLALTLFWGTWASCTDSGVAADAVAGSAQADATQPDNAAAAGDADPDAQAGELAALDLTAAETAAPCPGGAGCACATDDACDSGLCADDGSLVGGKSCAAKNPGTCPLGLAAYTLTAGEGIKLCVPAAPRLCRPCHANADCTSVGVTGAVCIDRGLDGGYCGIACPSVAFGGSCPSGYACQAVIGVAGDASNQCAAVTSEGKPAPCGCSAAAIGANASTACGVAPSDPAGQVKGVCKGTRACTAAGLGACSAQAPSSDLCDGQDNDCNGITDDNPACQDSDACTTNPGCVGAACGPTTTKTCSDGNPCTGDACDGQVGDCVHKPLDGALCSDGNPCTAGESCKAGACVGGKPAACACATQSDCSAGEDGNLCNGTLYCDVANKTCAINPATVVACPDDGQSCTDAVCAPASGTCATLALPDSATCSDGNPWTVGDSCQNGQCAAGPNSKLCKADIDCAKFEDGNLCNGTRRPGTVCTSAT